MNYSYFVLFFLLQLNNNILSDAAKILAPFSCAGKSHMNFFYPLLHELANRGHDVTVIAPYPSGAKIKNYNEIILEGGEKCKYSFFYFNILSTAIPRDTSLICSVTLLICQFVRISKQFSPLKLIEMPLIRSSPKNATPNCFSYVFLNKKNVFINDKYCLKT